MNAEQLKATAAVLAEDLIAANGIEAALERSDKCVTGYSKALTESQDLAYLNLVRVWAATHAALTELAK